VASGEELNFLIISLPDFFLLVCTVIMLLFVFWMYNT